MKMALLQYSSSQLFLTDRLFYPNSHWERSRASALQSLPGSVYFLFRLFSSPDATTGEDHLSEEHKVLMETCADDECC